MLKIDLHVHSIASGHAFNTIFELANEATKRRIKAIGIIEHGPSMEGAPHLGYFEMLYQIPKVIKGARIITGCECNIINRKGALDLPKNLQHQLEYVTAGLHKRTPYPIKNSIDQNTASIISAMKNNRIHAIVHPYRPEFPIDIKAVMNATKKCKVLMELNLSLLKRPDLDDTFLEQIKLILKIAKENDQKIIIGTDSHIMTDIGDDSALKKLGLKIPHGLILGEDGNIKKIENFLKSK